MKLFSNQLEPKALGWGWTEPQADSVDATRSIQSTVLRSCLQLLAELNHR